MNKLDFKKGDRVLPTVEAIVQGTFKLRYGTVVGTSSPRGLIQVVWDGNKPSSKHAISPNYLRIAEPGK